MLHVFDKIEKPDGDQRSYRYFELANGLRVVVVHDPIAVQV